MKENKNIDRLFQEKFKDFEAQPSDRVWNRIANAQKKKDDRKLIPLWWKAGGAAAIVMILIALGNVFLTNSSDESTPIVEVQVLDNESSSTVKPAVNKDMTLKNSSSIVSKANNSDNSNYLSTNKHNLAVDDKIDKFLGKATIKDSKNINDSKIYKSAVAENDASDKKSNGNFNKIESQVQPENITSDVKIGNHEFIGNSEKAIVSTDLKVNKKDLNAEAAKIKADRKNDALSIKEPNLNKDKWNVGAVAAPVYYGDFGGSGLDKQFADNDKSSDVNMSYGVQLSYAVSPKLRVRTGISSLDLSYETNEISYAASSSGVSSRSLSSSNTTTYIIIDGNASSSTNSFTGESTGIVSNGSLEQRLRYLEIPMEAIYSLSDKQVGFSIIGGVSTMMLNDNRVILASEEVNTNLGSSSNANEVSFSANFGLGIDYKITDKLQINLEPSFKYQLNAFDETVVDFKPFYLGVYTGLNYKF